MACSVDRVGLGNGRLAPDRACQSLVHCISLPLCCTGARLVFDAGARTPARARIARRKASSSAAWGSARRPISLTANKTSRESAPTEITIVDATRARPFGACPGKGIKFTPKFGVHDASEEGSRAALANASTAPSMTTEERVGSIIEVHEQTPPDDAALCSSGLPDLHRSRVRGQSARDRGRADSVIRRWPRPAQWTPNAQPSAAWGDAGARPPPALSESTRAQMRPRGRLPTQQFRDPPWRA